MQRVREILPAGRAVSASVNDRVIHDRVTLDAGDRQRRRAVMTGENGTTFLLDLEKPVTLRDGDGLVLDDGTIVLVAGKPEPLLEVSMRDKTDTVRLAWHIGNRHTDLQVVGEAFRIRRDHVLEDMLRGQGATIRPVEAPFDPEIVDSSVASGHGA